ncbi:MAG: hypothetical protein GX591_11210 [Planctomycetes bacterium]|nr:hypothetical protein [Planctomycetota bacterium]
MKGSTLAACLVVAALAAAGYAQSVTFDFEGITDVSQLTEAGWILVDDQTRAVGGVPTQFLDTIQIETEIVHSGTQALRLGLWDIAWLPVNGQFGTLDLWFYDYGYHISTYVTSTDGPRFGLRKFMDVDVSGHYPVNEPVDWGSLWTPYGIGAGLVHRSYLGSDGGYAFEAGATEEQNIITIGSPAYNYDPAAPVRNAGWAGDNTWNSPGWFGPSFGMGGRPAGWSHWRIAYLAPGQIEITLLESPTGTTRTMNPVGAHAFDGTVPGGLSDVCLYGGRGPMAGAEPEQWFGDGIFDDVTWTPLAQTVMVQIGVIGDANQDWAVDLDDFVVLKNHFGTGAGWDQGDFDFDGDVDLDDFVLLKNNFGESRDPIEAMGELSQYDFNGDGVADLDDFQIVHENYGRAIPGVAVGPPATPWEPW